MKLYRLGVIIGITMLTFGACEPIDPEEEKTEQTEDGKTDEGGAEEGQKPEGGDNGEEPGGGNGGSDDGGGDNGNNGDNGGNNGGNGSEGGSGSEGGNGSGEEDDDFVWEAGTYFAPGVTKESGWYDVNKKRDGMSDGDFQLCWAAAAANLVQWWLDRYKEAGYTLPAGAPDGKGASYEVAAFEKMKEAFGNDGCDINIGVHWYFTGEDRGVNISGFPHPVPGSGGYFKDSFPSIKAELGGDSYCEEILGYYIWGGGKSSNEDPLKIWSEIVKENILKGAIGMAIKPGFSSLHAVTLWGFDLDENGLISAIYMTDSDDQMSTPSAPRVQTLHHYTVSSSSGRVRIQNHFSGNVEITALTPLKQYPPVG